MTEVPCQQWRSKRRDVEIGLVSGKRTTRQSTAVGWSLIQRKPDWKRQREEGEPRWKLLQYPALAWQMSGYRNNHAHQQLEVGDWCAHVFTEKWLILEFQIKIKEDNPCQSHSGEMCMLHLMSRTRTAERVSRRTSATVGEWGARIQIQSIYKRRQTLFNVNYTRCWIIVQVDKTVFSWRWIFYFKVTLSMHCIMIINNLWI